MFNRVLLTGADGSLGRILRDGLKGVWPVLRLCHRRPLGDPKPGEEICLANFEVFQEVDAIMEGVDAVLHFGAAAEETDWEKIEASNILGTYNIFEAARCQGVKRIIYASSSHITGFYRREQTLSGTEPPRPDSLYGVSKAFSEALGRHYADKYGVGVINLRIGTCREYPVNRRMLSTWLSHRDFVQLVRICLEVPRVHYETVWGVSGNERSWWDNQAAYRLGYRPKDNAEDYLDQAMEGERKSREEGQPLTGVPAGPESDVERLLQGGHYCAIDFSGDLDRID